MVKKMKANGKLTKMVKKMKANGKLTKKEKEALESDIDNHMWYHCTKKTNCMNSLNRLEHFRDRIYSLSSAVHLYHAKSKI